ncbi:hypothetical protein HWV62_36853 [Athelia sp. TMB]|nr:hypothetical protein HWV62_36853 [Athelia sp. TMB]
MMIPPILVPGWLYSLYKSSFLAIETTPPDRLAINSPNPPIISLTATAMSSKPIKVGVVGLSSTGWAARAIAPGLINTPSFSLTAVSTTSAASAEASAKKYSDLIGHPVKAFHGDASGIANDKDVDLVAVAVKAPSHKEVALKIIEAGKDIFVEWPVGANSKDTNEIAAAAKSKGVKALVGLQGRHSTTARKVKEILESGKIGQVRSSTIIALAPREFGFWGPVVGEQKLYAVHANAGATLLSIGVGHLFDTFTYLLGDLATVSATTTQHYTSATVVDDDNKPTGKTVNPDAPDQIAFTGLFKSGAISSTIFRAGLPSSKGRKQFLWEIDGEDGSIRLESDAIGSSFINISNPSLYLNGELVDVPQASGPSDNITSAWEAFAQGEGYATLEDAVRIHQILDAVTESAQEGRAVHLIMPRTSLDRKDTLSKRLEELVQAQAATPNSPNELEKLEKQIKAVQRELCSLHNSDAPISTLPDEVLAMVFEEGMVPKGDRCRFGSLVSHVTHHWRSVALATPQLWSEIVWSKPCTAQEIERVSTFLSRTRTSPVEINFRPGYSATGKIPSEFLQLVYNHMSHCVHISIWDSDSRYLSIVLEGLTCHQAPMLRSIVLGIGREYYEPRPVLTAHLSPFEAPLLTTAHLSWIHASDLALCLPAFENLTSLKLTYLHINDREEKECVSFKDTLMAMPRLYCLDLQLGMGVGSFGLYEVFLHTIESLRIEACHGALGGVINSIHAKSLTTLCLVRRDDFEETRLAGEENWASQFPSLQHLVLENGIQEPQDIAVIARRFPSIKRLTYGLSWRRQTEHIEQVLDSICLAVKHDDHGSGVSTPHTNIGRPVVPWPKLDTIALAALDDTDTSITMLYERISKLRNAGYRIRKLKLPKKVFARAGEGIERLQSIVDLEEYSVDWPTVPYDR